MINSHRALLAVIISLALAASAYAQQSNTKTEDAEMAALRAKAFDLLESSAGQLGTLQSAENRARLAANIADSLWQHDEKRARDLLRMVESDIRTELQKYDPLNPDHPSLMVFMKLRVDTTERIAKHDPEAAVAFLKATKPNSVEPPAPRRAVYQDQPNVELQLAQQVVRKNPEAALILARESLDRGFSYDLVPVFRQLNRKNKDFAQELFNDIVQKLQRTNLVEDWNARYLAFNLVRTVRPPAVNESSFRDLLSVFIKTAQKNGCANKSTVEDGRWEFCEWLAREMPDMQKFDPGAAQLRQRNMNPEADSYSYVSPHQEFFDLLNDGANEELTAFAAKHPEIATEVYSRLIERERMLGNIDAARKLTTNIPDPERRKTILAQLDNEEKKLEITDAMLAEIEEKLEKKVLPFERAMYLLSQGHRFGQGDRTLALKFLKRAADVVDNMKPGKDQARAQLLLAVLYSYEKSDRGMAIMQSLVPKLNELVEVAARLDGFETNYLRDGEWNMSANGIVGELLTMLAQFAGPFAWQDFDRAVSLASGFDRPEIRLMAHVKLAQGILAGPPKRLPGVRQGR